MSEQNKCAICDDQADGFCPICKKTFCDRHASVDPSIIDPTLENDFNLPSVVCEDCHAELVDPESGEVNADRLSEFEQESGLHFGLGWAAIAGAYAAGKLASRYRDYDNDYDNDYDDDDDDESGYDES